MGCLAQTLQMVAEARLLRGEAVRREAHSTRMLASPWLAARMALGLQTWLLEAWTIQLLCSTVQILRGGAHRGLHGTGMLASLLQVAQVV